ncbi:MAG: tryptophan--tRNA ligase, partial [Acholeplasmataceae bacterium]|nr:tryptophan--tRNA ligase [Acholeplasmataceae bacterium]
ENKPGISNLLTIYSEFSGLSIKEIEQNYSGKTYRDLKVDLGELIVQKLTPIQEKYKEIINSKELDEALNKGRDRAIIISNRKLERVYHKVGLGRKK